MPCSRDTTQVQLPVMVVVITPDNERCFFKMERKRPARNKSNEADEMPALQRSFTLTVQ
jgi:hypothetical protein